MKEKRNISKHILQLKEVKIEVYVCNNCKKDIGTRGFGDIYESDYICNLCNTGHFCKGCMLRIDHGEKYVGDWTETQYIKICPSCKSKYQYIIKDITDTEKEIEDLQSDLDILKDDLLKRGVK